MATTFIIAVRKWLLPQSKTNMQTGLINQPLYPDKRSSPHLPLVFQIDSDELPAHKTPGSKPPSFIQHSSSQFPANQNIFIPQSSIPIGWYFAQNLLRVFHFLLFSRTVYGLLLFHVILFKISHEFPLDGIFIFVSSGHLFRLQLSACWFSWLSSSFGSVSVIIRG